MKNKKKLEIVLSGLLGFDEPKPDLEQMATPGDIAKLMVTLASPDIEGKTVLDLGAGTGVLSIAASLIGAEKVIAVEVDSAAAAVMKLNLEKTGIKNVEIIQMDVSDFSGKADCAIMNPPFGAQLGNLHADRLFLEKALECADVAYSLHLTKTRTFIRSFSEQKNWKDEVLGTFKFPLTATFDFHKKPKKIEEVDYHRICK